MTVSAKQSLVNWIVWKKDETGSRYIKCLMKGTIWVLVQHFIGMVDKFLMHSHIKRVQSKTFEKDRTKIDVVGDLAILQMDYAENFTCFAQDEIQSAHWNQNTVSNLGHPNKNENLL